MKRLTPLKRTSTHSLLFQTWRKISKYPVASDTKPNAVNDRIKELQKELREARKEHAATVNALTAENTALKQEIEAHKDHLSFMRTRTKVRERKGLPTVSNVKTTGAAEEIPLSEKTKYLEDLEDLKDLLQYQREQLKSVTMQIEMQKCGNS